MHVTENSQQEQVYGLAEDANCSVSTREAHQALLDLKKIVDGATRKIRAAELEAVGLAIGRSQGEDTLRTLRSVAETIGSSHFDAVVWQARKKIETAVAICLSTEEL